jgi:hypothetical protein
MKRIPEGSAPDFKNKSWTIAAEVNIPKGGADGVIATIGGRFGGWTLLLQGKPLFTYAVSNQPKYKWKVQAAQPLPPGDHIVRVAFKYDGGGIGRGVTATEKMPFRFSGTLNKFVVVLEPHNLSPEEQQRLHDALAKAMMAVQ